jgi:hypothetical protein
MTSAELDAKLMELLGLPAETEWVEFKEAKNDYHFDRLGEYFSALSNEPTSKANLGHGSYLASRTSPSRSSAPIIEPIGCISTASRKRSPIRPAIG